MQVKVSVASSLDSQMPREVLSILQLIRMLSLHDIYLEEEIYPTFESCFEEKSIFFVHEESAV